MSEGMLRPFTVEAVKAEVQSAAVLFTDPWDDDLSFAEFTEQFSGGPQIDREQPGEPSPEEQ